MADTAAPENPKKSWKLDGENKFRFSICSYNILADAYCNEQAFGSSTKKSLNWGSRKTALTKMIESIDADIFCLQEVDHVDDFWRPMMGTMGYRSLYSKRKTKRDGCCTFYRKSKFAPVENWILDFDVLAEGEDAPANWLTHNTALVSALKHLESDRLVVVGNAHIYWNPSYEAVKEGQIAMYLRHLYQMGIEISKDPPPLQHVIHTPISPTSLSVPVIGCGDFNSLPDSTAYAIMRSGFSSAYFSLHGSEPACTNYRDTFQGTLDYLFFSPRLVHPVSARPLPSADSLQPEGSLKFLPTPDDPSDHWPVAVEMIFL